MRGEILLTIAGMALVTYLTRSTFLVLLGKVELPDWLTRGLRYIPLGIMMAFIAPSLVAPQGTLDISLSNYYLPAGLVAAIVALRWKNVFLSMGSGVGTVLLLRLIVG